MKLALITALKLDRSYQTAIPPLTYGYLASYLERYGDPVEIVICRDPSEVVAEKPDVVGISCVSENYPIARNYAQQLKVALGAPVILGGPHISVLPGTLHEAFDAAVLGEGEETLVELLRLCRSGKPTAERLSAVRGVAFHRGGSVVKTAPRAMIKPLERIPRPRRDLLPWKNFHYLLTSRGCPYACTFCASANLWRKYRAFPPEYVVDEMEEILDSYHQPYLHIFDDLFIANPTRLGRIKNLVVERGVHTRVTFGCHVRANIMSDSLCRTLREMNCLFAGFGAESGSERLLHTLKCGTATVEQNQRTVDLCHEHGIKLSGSFMIGLPTETPEDLRLTREFIVRNRAKLDAIEVALLTPYPGTPVWDMALARGIVSEDMDWERIESHPFFCEMQVRDDYPYMGDVIPWKEFGKYIEEFQSIEREINRSWLGVFDAMK